MPRLVYNASAGRELIAIAAHVSGVNADPAKGQGFVERRTRRCARLSSLPAELGRPRPDLGRDLRSSVCEGHLIVFRYDRRTGQRNHIVGAHLLNGRRDSSRLLARLGSPH